MSVAGADMHGFILVLCVDSEAVETSDRWESPAAS